MLRRKSGLTMHAFCLLLALITASRISTVSADIECLVCSYSYISTSPQARYGCVTDARNFEETTRVNCTSNMCLTRAIYTKDYQRLNSVTRGCGFTATDRCDAPISNNPKCEVTCNGPLCNGKPGDLWRRRQIDNDASLTGPSALVLSLVLIMYLLMK